MVVRIGLLLLTCLLLSGVLTACGGSSAKPTPTPRSSPAASGSVRTDRRAVTAARTFLQAFKRGDKATELSLESPLLRRRNEHEFIAQMLGAKNRPQRVDVVRTRTYTTKHGAWTRVVARLRFAHSSVVDALAVIRTRSGYRVNTIQRVRTS